MESIDGPAAPLETGRGHERAGSARALAKAEKARVYGSSALRAARLFHYAPSDAGVLELADLLQSTFDLPAVAVVDAAEGRALGILRRDRLFALLGKPFGREILGRSRVSELVEPVPAFDAHDDLFAVAGRVLAGGCDYCLLLGPGGRFLGLLASQDLANYLSKMTQDDIELAGRIQERLMRVQAADTGEAEAYRGLEAWSRPAKGVGGDFYFSRRLPDGKLFLALCDVSGKGVAASLVVSMLWGMLAMFDYGRGLRDLVVGVNESIVSTFHMEKYLTGLFLIFDPGPRRLLAADMGHSHAVVLRAGKPRSLRGPRGNLPLGVELELDPAIYPYLLEAGDELLVYSDGLVEQEDARGREFGESRFVETAAAALSRGESLKERIPREIDEYRGDIPQQDDMSFILLSV
jgi:sigma-B regulation protein RsbU (phosphoserine phosphatase)